MILHGTRQLVVCVSVVTIQNGSVLVTSRHENGLEVITEEKLSMCLCLEMRTHDKITT